LIISLDLGLFRMLRSQNISDALLNTS